MLRIDWDQGIHVEGFHHSPGQRVGVGGGGLDHVG